MKHGSRLKREEYRAFYKIFRKAVLNFFGIGKPRTVESVREAYNEDWQYLPSSMKIEASPGPSRIDNTRVFMWRSIDRRKYVLREVKDVLESFDTRSVVEFGSGNGINVLSLAVLCPRLTKLRGLELSATGVRTAKAFLSNPPFEAITYITGRPREEIEKRLKEVDIDFVEGDMTKPVPFADGEFDSVFSQHAIEQIPVHYREAFREARRIARTGVFVEPFAEAQRHLIHWLYITSSDYFRASYHEVEKVGFTPVRFDPIVAKAKHGSGLLVCV